MAAMSSGAPGRNSAAGVAGRLTRLAPFAAVTAAAVLVAWPSLLRQEIDGLDEAQNLMGGLFFVDVFRDLPVLHPVKYGFDYYAQYPALGFAFWPPLFHLVEGLFFAVFGFGLVVGRACLLAFAVLLACCLYSVAAPRTGRTLAALGAALALAAPPVAELQNTMLLEVPCLAMTFAAVALYQRVVSRGRWNGWGEPILVAATAAAALYTKQTAVFIFPAMLFDAWWNHRELLKDRRTWLCMAAFLLMCVPLAWFTLKFGGANLAQSVGNLGNIFVPAHKVSSRWSLEGWTYYARELAELVNPALLALAAGAAVCACFRREFFRSSAIWIAAAASWYVMFSFFDNKQPRFVAFVVPLLVLLAASLLAELARGSKRLHAAACGLLAVVLVVQGAAAVRHRYVGYSGMGPIVRQLLDEDGKGNIAYFGNYRQMFVPYVRVYDPERTVHVLQGDDITEEAGDVARACRDYRVRWVLLDAPPTGKLYGSEIEEQVGSRSEFRPVRPETFGKPGFRIPMMIYEYVGPVAGQMRPVPLRSDTLRIYYR